MTQDVRSDPGGLVPGEQLAGYQIQEQIGRGGMAVVYRALDLRLGRQVALKVLAPNLGEDEAFRQRFIRESRAAAGVDHPHIIPVFEAGEAAGMLFIAMRYVGHGDVRSLIEAHGRLGPGQGGGDHQPGRFRAGRRACSRTGPSRRQARQHPAGAGERRQ